MNSFYKIWHQIWHPNCPECALELHNEQEASLHCESCETLKQVNQDLRAQNNLLVSLLTDKPNERANQRFEEVNPEPIRARNIPWKVRREQLEERDRLVNQENQDTTRKVKAKIEELEKELLTEIPEHPFKDMTSIKEAEI